MTTEDALVAITVVSVLISETSPLSDPEIQSSQGSCPASLLTHGHLGLSLCLLKFESVGRNIIVGIKKWNLRIRKSLPCLYIGIRQVVDGSDLIQFFKWLLTMMFYALG